VKEITSVSATFLLSTRSEDSEDPHPHEPHLQVSSRDDDSIFHDDIPSPSDVLLHGRELAVKVNGQPWHKIFPAVSDDGEDATIVLYGLMPGRHYEVELNVLSNNKERERPTAASITSTATVNVSTAEEEEPGQSHFHLLESKLIPL
jgi:hypothetical protein